MEKINDETRNLRKYNYGCYWEEWEFVMDLNFTYSELSRCLPKLVLSKFRLIPKPQKNSHASVWG
jgi:hypothetical protein